MPSVLSVLEPVRSRYSSGNRSKVVCCPQGSYIPPRKADDRQCTYVKGVGSNSGKENHMCKFRAGRKSRYLKIKRPQWLLPKYVT